MLLRGIENTTFEMTIVGYEFPHLVATPYDSDWLNIRVSVQHPAGSWTGTDACMLTWEVEQLAIWLQSIADEAVVEPQLRFLEPELRFEFFDGTPKHLRVYFNYELRPPWSPYVSQETVNDIWVDCVINVPAVVPALQALLADLARFPPRVGV